MVSNTGIAKIAKVKGISPNPSSANEEHMESVERIRNIKTENAVPIISEPPSPMNILVFSPNTLCKTNGIKAPTHTRAKDPIAILPALKKMMENKTKATIAKPEQ